ncbi:MAG: hypothetical protein IKJ39_11030 [Lachnospiraceae bacterium]|nr:hypothetical protein [Lachnospiraceae bacterium]
MKKILLTCLLIMFCIIPSSDCFAAEPTQYLYSAYTTDGIYYEVYVNEISQQNEMRNSGYSINIDLVYDGLIIPSKTIPWSQTINGTVCTGTLKLYSFSQHNGKTTANYQGIIYPI